METPNQWEVVASLGTRSREAFLQSGDIPTLQDTLPGIGGLGHGPGGWGVPCSPRLSQTASTHPSPPPYGRQKGRHMPPLHFPLETEPSQPERLGWGGAGCGEQAQPAGWPAPPSRRSGVETGTPGTQGNDLPVEARKRKCSYQNKHRLPCMGPKINQDRPKRHQAGRQLETQVASKRSP